MMQTTTDLQINTQGVCPTCGRCPTCGHAPHDVPVMPWVQPYPAYVQPYPWNPYYGGGVYVGDVPGFLPTVTC